MRQIEGVGKKFAKGADARLDCAGCGRGRRKCDRRPRRAEFGENLTAGSAGWAGGLVEVGNGDGLDANLRTTLGDGTDQRGSLGAESKSVAGIFDICSGDDLTRHEQKRRADAEAGVRRIGVNGCGDCGGEQMSGIKDLRHGGRFSVLEPGRKGKRFKFWPAETDKSGRVANVYPRCIAAGTGRNRMAGNRPGTRGHALCAQKNQQEGRRWMI